jgi:hypothetical protein
MNHARTILLVCAVALALGACRHVPNDVIKGKGGNGQNHSQLVNEAREAYDLQPRSFETVRVSLDKFAEALKTHADDYEVLWQAGRAASWLGEFMPDRVARRPIIKEGIKYTNTALKLKPEGVEARFYHGVLAGMLGDVDHDYGLNAAKTVDEDMRLLAEKNADVSHAGPWRVLGVLQMRAPGPPTSVGSLRNARKNLLAAVEKAPDWPENQLYCAEMEFAWAKEKDAPQEAQSARDRLQKYLLGPEAKAPEGASYEFAQWQNTARELLKANP